jgi:hypothetical protein
VSGFEIRLPIRDPNELVSVKAASELPDHLTDPDDKAVTRELIHFAHEIGLRAGQMLLPLGALSDMLEEDFSLGERKSLFRLLRRRAGLSSPESMEYEGFRRTYAPDTSREVRLVFTESGAIIDAAEAEAEAQRARAHAETLRVREETRRAQAEVAARNFTEHEDAVGEQMHQELPAHLRGRAPHE